MSKKNWFGYPYRALCIVSLLNNNILFVHSRGVGAGRRNLQRKTALKTEIPKFQFQKVPVLTDFEKFQESYQKEKNQTKLPLSKSLKKVKKSVWLNWDHFQSLLVHLYHLCQKNLWNSKNFNTKRCWQEKSTHLPKMERYWRKVISKHFLSQSITLWNPWANQNVILFIKIQKKCTNKYLCMKNALKLKRPLCIAVDCRAVGRSENPGVPVSFGGHDLPPWLRIMASGNFIS